MAGSYAHIGGLWVYGVATARDVIASRRISVCIRTSLLPRPNPLITGPRSLSGNGG